jgi:hypothetical protein
VSRSGWKQVERDAAALFGARRFWANAGERCDFEGHRWIGQVKSVKTLSLAGVEALALEMEEAGAVIGKYGAVVVKRSAGSGQSTPMLVVMTAEVWRRLMRNLWPELVNEIHASRE